MSPCYIQRLLLARSLPATDDQTINMFFCHALLYLILWIIRTVQCPGVLDTPFSAPQVFGCPSAVLVRPLCL